jgi:selenocysteine lyase/cysteine desulfurase
MNTNASGNNEKVSRREFTRLVACGGSAALIATPTPAVPRPGPFPVPRESPDERFWAGVREQFVMPRDLAVMNAANLCPSSAPVLEAMYRNTRDVDQDPSFNNREKMTEGKETTRRLLAEFLHVTPEEIVITRNTSESNNLVSSGVELKAGDEVVIFSDNHPSNHLAWQEKAKRFGFTVRVVEQVNPHPGPEYYIDAFTKQMSSRTKLLSFTHLTSTAGDLLPARELCRAARERGVLSMVDGAQSFGLMDVDLSDMQPDFYSGSAHKWPCGPKETGLLFIHKSAHTRIWPSVYSAFPGAVGISKTFERFGQRDEPAIIAFGEALKFQTNIGRRSIEQRSRELTQMFIREIRKVDGIKLWTSPDPARSVAVVTFMPGSLDLKKLSLALYQKERIAGATREGADRPGLRFSPHIYNSPSEVERALAAIKRYMSAGV